MEERRIVEWLSQNFYDSLRHDERHPDAPFVCQRTEILDIEAEVHAFAASLAANGDLEHLSMMGHPPRY